MIKICHLYPELLNLYGDRGNVIAFVRRCQWRGIDVVIQEANLDDPVDFSDLDFLFLGGGSDREQNLIAGDLKRRREELRGAVEDGLVVLAICGGYQLLGQYYRSRDGQVIPGLGLLNFYTEAGEKRLLGNVVIEVALDGALVRVCGFENHSGRTFLSKTEPLGKVLSGNGNNGCDGWEGARYKNVFCSYLHGPLLPKNAALTDHLIALTLKRRGLDLPLIPLDDCFEKRACRVLLDRLL
ncbi:MAG: glutamine amidotransferase [Peptococcaceae bacterium]|nr:MAG: glutamine amidotransferase [Peptococcaceae bacterium]